MSFVLAGGRGDRLRRKRGLSNRRKEIYENVVGLKLILTCVDMLQCVGRVQQQTSLPRRILASWRWKVDCPYVGFCPRKRWKRAVDVSARRSVRRSSFRLIDADGCDEEVTWVSVRTPSHRLMKKSEKINEKCKHRWNHVFRLFLLLLLLFLHSLISWYDVGTV